MAGPPSADILVGFSCETAARPKWPRPAGAHLELGIVRDYGTLVETEASSEVAERLSQDVLLKALNCYTACHLQVIKDLKHGVNGVPACVPH